MSLLISVFFKIQIIFDMRGFWIDERSDRQGLRKESIIYIFFKKIEKYLYYKSAKIITLTQEAKNIIINDHPFLIKNKIHVIPTCADENYFIPSPKNKKQKDFLYYIYFN